MTGSNRVVATREPGGGSSGAPFYRKLAEPSRRGIVLRAQLGIPTDRFYMSDYIHSPTAPSHVLSTPQSISGGAEATFALAAGAPVCITRLAFGLGSSIDSSLGRNAHCALMAR